MAVGGRTARGPQKKRPISLSGARTALEVCAGIRWAAVSKSAQAWKEAEERRAMRRRGEVGGGGELGLSYGSKEW